MQYRRIETQASRQLRICMQRIAITAESEQKRLIRACGQLADQIWGLLHGYSPAAIGRHCSGDKPEAGRIVEGLL